MWFDEEGDKKKFLGGRDDTIAWCRKFVSVSDAVAEANNGVTNVDPWNKDHGYEYDLVVIGGGSGGLACSKEASKLGAKVAVLDFVKPSPLGSKWGLGGTCVNVGCIPKKLMHNASVIGEHSLSEGSFYGWKGHEGLSHDWETMRSNVQDHIKGLNFGYRVNLREEGVTYLNKLGRFISPHELECTDAKGAKQIITAARFVVAVGGRPTPLECPGGELALSSDDIFMKEAPPGKTCVVGAGYVALECAGFLTGLKGGDVTVLVRSMLLRGFDREMVDAIKAVMVHNGTKIIEGVLPSSIEKLPSGKLRVTVSDGTIDEFDTVLAAVGRKPDLPGLGLVDSLQVTTGPSGKILCQNEQSSIPHIYAIGDVVEGAPELTPVAIQAGRLLARRLFGDSEERMTYKNIATTVFTPLEFGTVGLNEEEAISLKGADNIEVYVSSFQPLEWSIVQDYSELSCMAKVIVDKNDNERVLGMHIAAPNAGEIIQGFAVAFRKGLFRADLLATVGIHPTTAEELCGLEVSKSSGKSTKKSGC